MAMTLSVHSILFYIAHRLDLQCRLLALKEWYQDFMVMRTTDSVKYSTTRSSWLVLGRKISKLVNELFRSLMHSLPKLGMRPNFTGIKHSMNILNSLTRTNMLLSVGLHSHTSTNMCLQQFLGTFIYCNYVQALECIHSHKEFLRHFDLTPQDFELDLAEEHSYLEAASQCKSGDSIQVEYVKALNDLDLAR